VQSGGIQPVEAMPAKLLELVGASDGAEPKSGAAAANAALISTFFPRVSLTRSAVGFASLAFGAALFNVSNASLEIGYRLV